MDVEETLSKVVEMGQEELRIVPKRTEEKTPPATTVRTITTCCRRRIGWTITGTRVPLTRVYLHGKPGQVSSMNSSAVRPSWRRSRLSGRQAR